MNPFLYQNLARLVTIDVSIIIGSLNDSPYCRSWSQADPEIDGPSLICKPIHNTVYAVYSYNEHTSYPNATITYSVKDRDGDSFNSGDLSTSISGGVLTVTINKNDFDFIVKMTVKDGTTTIGVYNLKTQVGLGDEPTNDMISFNKTPRCGSDSYVTVTIDKERIYGVEFHWTLPSGWTQIEG